MLYLYLCVSFCHIANVSRVYVYVYPLCFGFPSHLGQCRALGRVPCVQYSTVGDHSLSILYTGLCICGLIENSPTSAGGPRNSGSTPGLGRSPGEGNGDPVYSPGKSTHSSILAWRIPWTEEPGGLQARGSQRVSHD